MRRDDARLRMLQRNWSNGGSALPLMRYHVENDENDEAAIVGRAALSMRDCRDAKEIEDLLAAIESTPAGWDAAIRAFIDRPSKEGWDGIIRFAPGDLVYTWTRKAFREIANRGGDPNALIRFGSTTGITPDVMALVDSGLVEAETLIERANEPGAARAFWLGLAAQAAYQQGDRFRTVALLREAWACADEYSTPLYSVFSLREENDAALEKMMRSAGVWEVDRS